MLGSVPFCGVTLLNFSVEVGGRRSNLASLSNRTLLVNNLFDLALYAGNRVVSAVGNEAAA